MKPTILLILVVLLLVSCTYQSTPASCPTDSQSFELYSENTEPILSIPFRLQDHSTQYWGMIPFCPKLNSGQVHNALDFELKPDAIVYAAESGKVINTEIGAMEGSAEVIQIKGDGFTIDYSGLKNLRFNVGDIVNKGDIIGNAAKLSHGEHHVHIGLIINEKYVCPIKYMDQEFKEATKLMYSRSNWDSQLKGDFPCICNC